MNKYKKPEGDSIDLLDVALLITAGIAIAIIIAEFSGITGHFINSFV